MSQFAEKVRLLTLKSRADRASSIALGHAMEVKIYTDFGLEPPAEVVSEFLAAYDHAERLYLEFLIAQDTVEESR